ncbi:nucleophile aminohydrolase [Ilyonectria sp. MPI-CAGE-AT-0026]|nr:nucleophile aminohydrolase [Ilyonectria sp. MPI-CAGE-AT-0026]
MEYRAQDIQHHRVQPRLIIHGGAGNIQRHNYPPEKYQAYRDALITIVTKTNVYMNTPAASVVEKLSPTRRLPSALDVATFAVALLEDNPLFNSGHGAVFTRDGVNELEASVMVSRGYKKRGVGVMGLRRVRNPIVLARKMLEHGQDDLQPQAAPSREPRAAALDVPSAQGHTQIFGDAAEQLAAQYGMDLVAPGYFFTQQRWDEHLRALEQEKNGSGLATWSATEYLPQGTCGAVALDEDGVICVATSTGGLTNKLTGRIGDTPVVGAGFWAEEWSEDGDPTRGGDGIWQRFQEAVARRGPSLVLGDALTGALADCLPTPLMYSPLAPWTGGTTTIRSMGGSGTGNGDSFLRINALRTAAAMARWKPETSAKAVTHVAGPGGELQKSAEDRWRRTGEGEGGIIGIECALVRDAAGRVVEARSEILMDYNCGGMFRAWIDDYGEPVMSVWTNGSADDLYIKQHEARE